jgi:hypothetical protein
LAVIQNAVTGNYEIRRLDSTSDICWWLYGASSAAYDFRLTTAYAHQADAENSSDEVPIKEQEIALRYAGVLTEMQAGVIGNPTTDLNPSQLQLDNAARNDLFSSIPYGRNVGV